MDGHPEAQSRPDQLRAGLEAVQEWLWYNQRGLLAWQREYLSLNPAAHRAPDRAGGKSGTIMHYLSYPKCLIM